MNNVSQPLFQSPHDYVFNMTALSRGEARRLWRSSIKKAWDNRCAYCGKPPIDDKSLTIDHVKPRSKGGEDTTSNTIPACKSCNQDKGSDDWIAWYRMQPFYTIHGEIKIKEWLEKGVVKDGGLAETEWYDQLVNEVLPTS